MTAALYARPRVVVLSTVLITLGVATGAFATSSNMKLFKRTYHPRSTELGRCSVCHLLTGEDDEPNKADVRLNGYGQDWKTAGTSEMGLKDIEGRDSDGDGYSNIREIHEGSNPGDAQRIPAVGDPDRPTASRPPSTESVPPPTPDGEGPGREGEGVLPGRDVTPTTPDGQPAVPGGTPPEAPPTVPTVPGSEAPPPTPPEAPTPPPEAPAPPEGSAPPPPTPPVTAAAKGDYPILYVALNQGQSELHLLKAGQDTVVSAGMQDLESWGWSAGATYVWFIARPAAAAGTEPGPKALYVVIAGTPTKVSGDIMVDPRSVVWLPNDSMVLFIPYTPPGPATLYGVTLPDAQLKELATVAGGRISGLDVAPAPAP